MRHVSRSNEMRNNHSRTKSVVGALGGAARRLGGCAASAAAGRPGALDPSVPARRPGGWAAAGAAGRPAGGWPASGQEAGQPAGRLLGRTGRRARTRVSNENLRAYGPAAKQDSAHQCIYLVSWPLKYFEAHMLNGPSCLASSRGRRR